MYHYGEINKKARDQTSPILPLPLRLLQLPGHRPGTVAIAWNVSIMFIGVSLVTALAVGVVALGAIITIKRKPIEFTTPKWMEWVQRLVDGK